MILITTATGHLGQATVDFLLKKNAPASQIAALVRDPKKAASLVEKGVAVRTGDYFDKASLEKAFQGIDTLVFISSGNVVNRTQQHDNVVDAAETAGVKHIIYTSMLKASNDSKFFPSLDHVYTEEVLKLSGISYTILRNTFYADLLPHFLGNALQSGAWYYAAGEAKANFASRFDMAEALANVALHPSQHVNKVYEIASGKSYSFSDIASIISKVTGKQVSYIPISTAAMKEGMKQAGVPEDHIPTLVSVAEAISAGELDVVDDTLEKLLNRKPADLNECLPKLLS